MCYMGPSGSGKSTTLKLMTRMIDPTEGGVYVMISTPATSL